MTPMSPLSYFLLLMKDTDPLCTNASVDPWDEVDMLRWNGGDVGRGPNRGEGLWEKGSSTQTESSVYRLTNLVKTQVCISSYNSVKTVPIPLWEVTLNFTPFQRITPFLMVYVVKEMTV